MSDKMVVISSDFKRTKETAEVILEHFSVKTPLRLDTRLRERGLGSYEYQPQQTYREIVKKDVTDPTQTEGGCESLMSLVSRMSHALCDVDKELNEKIILLVSHGDSLLTLYAVCSGFLPTERLTKCKQFNNCEIREIVSS